MARRKCRSPLRSTRISTSPAAPPLAMANLAARIRNGNNRNHSAAGVTRGREAKPKDVKSQPVIIGDSALAQEAEKKLRAEDTAPPLNRNLLSRPAKARARVVDDAFPKHGAVLVKGDTPGSVAALDLLSGRFPNLLGTRQAISVARKYSLRLASILFAARSSAGQAAAALYHLTIAGRRKSISQQMAHRALQQERA